MNAIEDTNDDTSFSAINESENIHITIVVNDASKDISSSAINESEVVNLLLGEIEDANEDWSASAAKELKDILHFNGIANENMS